MLMEVEEDVRHTLQQQILTTKQNLLLHISLKKERWHTSGLAREKQAISFIAFSAVLTRLLGLINQSQSQQD